MEACEMTTQVATTVTVRRHYRVAALPYEDAPSLMPAAQSVLLAEQAERDLRARLEAGEVPEVALIAPERSCVSDIGPDGTLTGPCFAWSGDDHGPLSSAWIHSPHAVGELEVDSWAEDMMSAFYADHGSVQVTGGRLTSLEVSPWLAPVADQLRTRYGVPVTVIPGEDIPAPVVTAAPPVVIPGALPLEACDALWCWFVDELNSGDLDPIEGRNNLGRPYAATPEITELAGTLLQHIGAQFDLPVTAWETAVTIYYEGDDFYEHTDADDRLANNLDRTVSFSLLLADPGEDYEGGDLVVNGEVVPMKRGDCVGFTARTPHRVTPITKGTRLVWIAFGEVAR